MPPRSPAQLVLIVVLNQISASPAVAQARVATLDQLQHELAPGDSISLVRTGGESLTGRLLRFGDSDLELRIVIPRQPGREGHPLDVTIPLETIRSLERPRDSSRNGALIGATVGAGFAGAMFVSAVVTDRNEIDEWAPIYFGYGALFTGIGGLVGWAIDSANSKPHIRFDRPSAEGTKVWVVPLLSRRRGLAVGVSF
jgi:hypothetical protein